MLFILKSHFHSFILIACFCLSPFLAGCNNTFGASAKFWRQETAEDFIKGNVNNVVVYSNGSIKLTQKRENIYGINASYVWCMGRGKNGHVFAGTGDPGIVYKITEQKEAVEVFRPANELHFLSMAIDQQGNIYCGTAPDGIIYKIDCLMRTEIFCDLPERYIWDIVIDDNENLYAATGTNGKIYKISKDGKIKVILNSQAAHILDLEIDDDNTIYACTEPFGLIYKITNIGSVQILYDAIEGETHCLTLGKDGFLYAGTAVSAKPNLYQNKDQMANIVMPPFAGAGPNSISNEEKDPWMGFGRDDYTPENELNMENLDTGDQKQEMQDLGIFLGTDVQEHGINCIYKISKDGSVKKVMETGASLIMSLVSDNQNNIYAGTDNPAEILKIDRSLLHTFNIDTQELTATLFNAQSSQILALLMMDNQQFYAGTGNNGSVFKVSNEYSTNGVYESPVQDASVTAKWGRITWEAIIDKGTSLNLFTRSGNSQIPDNTWNDWELIKAEDLKPFSNVYSGTINSPRSRFIQYRAELSTINSIATPILKTVSIAYLPANQQPNIIRIDIKNNKISGLKLPKEDDNEISLIPSTNGKMKDVSNKLPQKKIIWEVNDPDEDQILINLFYKAVNDTDWISLAKAIHGRDYFIWDTNIIPDGKYLIKILVDDLLSNPKQTSLQVEKISSQFVIDNTKPVVKEINVTIVEDGCEVTGTVFDNMSELSKIQLAIDSGIWIPLYPIDEIFDYNYEAFQFSIPKLPSGEHTLTIKATDSEENVGGKEVVVKM